jgi:hypothetical protein
LTDTETARRTVVFQKDNGITPIDHPVDRGLEKVEKPHVDKDPYLRLHKCPVLSVVRVMQTLDRAASPSHLEVGRIM